MAKFIFVTGGVVSSLGKGLTAASLGRLLESRGLTVTLQKFDPYINVDPGTLSPFQHGEVYVTDDGAETDLDLGHYERFTSAVMSKANNVTTGQVYESVIRREREGAFLGKTVQVVPHITDEIKARIMKLVKDNNVDVAISEVGGTVGDIEGLPFLEAIRQFRLNVGKENVLYIHLTLIPYIKAAGELKTKPTQHSVEKLREIGIQPDILVCRTERHLNKEIKSKISLFCNVPIEAVIEEKDVDYSVYELPIMFQREKIDEIILNLLNLKCADSDLSEWKRMLRRVKSPAKSATIAVVGKYIELQDAYKSIYEAIAHGGIANNCRVEVKRIDAENIEKDGAASHFKGVAGILVPGGFGGRGTEGKILATAYARKKKVPFLGICLGMQCAVIEYSRNVCGLQPAGSAEFVPDVHHPVICLMDEQRKVTKKGGTMRLGAYPCCIQKGTRAYEAYQTELIEERHRHRYEFNNKYSKEFTAKDFVISGTSPDGCLVEMIELKNHPWFVAVQFHPEFKSKPDKAHPLFRNFIAAALKWKK